MKRVFQSFLGGIGIPVILVGLARLLEMLLGSAWPGSALWILLLSPVALFSLVFPPRTEDLLFSNGAFWATCVFDFFICVLAACLVFALFDSKSNIRAMIRGCANRKA